jgi:hypothetical protein
LLLGYGSDRWWRVQVIAMFAATGAIVVLGAYHYVHAPVRVELSVLEATLSSEPGSPFLLRTELSFSNTGSQQVAVTDVALCLARHNPPRCYIVTGSPLEGAAHGVFALPCGRCERRMFEFVSPHDSVSEGLDIRETGHFLVEASLRVTVIDHLGRERRIPVEGMTVVVDDGALRDLGFGGVVARYVGR